jgi:hypothetical protein
VLPMLISAGVRAVGSESRAHWYIQVLAVHHQPERKGETCHTYLPPPLS